MYTSSLRLHSYSQCLLIPVVLLQVLFALQLILETQLDLSMLLPLLQGCALPSSIVIKMILDHLTFGSGTQDGLVRFFEPCNDRFVLI